MAKAASMKAACEKRAAASKIIVIVISYVWHGKSAAMYRHQRIAVAKNVSAWRVNINSGISVAAKKEERRRNGENRKYGEKSNCHIIIENVSSAAKMTYRNQRRRNESESGGNGA